jgi:cytochrome P450
MVPTAPLLATSCIPGPHADFDAVAYNALKHDYITQLHEAYGDIVAVCTQSAAHIQRPADANDDVKRIVFVRDPKAVSEVLHSDDRFAKTWDAADRSSKTGDYVHNLVQPCLSDTVFNNTVDRGRTGVHSGRVLMKATFGASEQFEAPIEKCVERWIQKKSASWVGAAVNVQTIAHELIKQALLVAVVGSTLAEEAAELMEHDFQQVMDYFVEKYADSSHKVDVTDEDSANLGRLEAVITPVVRRWYELDGPSLTSGADRSCLLRVMHKGGFDEMHMARMVVNTIIAGGEAPGIALAATLEELARLPSLQDRVAKEVTKCVGVHGCVAPHLGSLRQLDNTVLEGLRLFSPATLVMRAAVKDTQLCGYEVPAGTVVGICVTAVHNCSKIFSNPLSFEPEEREGLDYVLLKQNKPFVPFSAGPRGCPGKHIGTSLLRICLAKLLQHYTFALPSHGASSDGIRVAKFAGWKVNGIHLRMRRRELPSAL